MLLSLVLDANPFTSGVSIGCWNYRDEISHTPRDRKQSFGESAMRRRNPSWRTPSRSGCSARSLRRRRSPLLVGPWRGDDGCVACRTKNAHVAYRKSVTERTKACRTAPPLAPTDGLPQAATLSGQFITGRELAAECSTAWRQAKYLHLITTNSRLTPEGHGYSSVYWNGGSVSARQLRDERVRDSSSLPVGP